MKKTVKILAVVMSVLLLCVALASCGSGLSGKYSRTDYGMTTAFDFDGDKVEMSISMGGLSYSVEGTYELGEDKITFSFDDPDGNNSILQNALKDFEQAVDYEKTDDGIKIGGVEYAKAE